MIHTMRDGFTVRSASMDDAERVSDFWNERLQVTRGVRSSTPEQVRKLWNHPKFDLTTDSLLVFTPEGCLAGYAHVRDVKDPPVDIFTAHSVHPDYDQETWLWDALFAWTGAEARRVIPRAPANARIVLVAGVADEDTTKQSQLEGHGFEYSRSFHRMQINFPEAGSAYWSSGIPRECRPTRTAGPSSGPSWMRPRTGDAPGRAREMPL